MIQVRDYRQTAAENEAVFRNVLMDLKNNCAQRPMGIYVPEDLKVDLPIDEFFKIYSAGQRMGIFTICDFQMHQPNSARLSFKDVAFMSGGGAELEYLVKEDKSVEYQGHGIIVRS
ncbi:MAG: hypothetical protein PHD81_04410 [Candidatus Nanoarchaeia archaeon]|nr:hypothetical protein [Candidatus Nanoarchaeia archaeon]MDD5588321.1 hypothetical protein [Candidatus Nanoarchaeia archaeon]